MTMTRNRAFVQSFLMSSSLLRVLLTTKVVFRTLRSHAYRAVSNPFVSMWPHLRLEKQRATESSQSGGNLTFMWDSNHWQYDLWTSTIPESCPCICNVSPRLQSKQMTRPQGLSSFKQFMLLIFENSYHGKMMHFWIRNVSLNRWTKRSTKLVFALTLVTV